jgi:Zn-dependent protease with chaperone function
MPKDINMNSRKDLDIYARMSSNRMRLALAIAILMTVVMALSGLAIYLMREAFDLDIDFWLLWTLFWLLCLLYTVLRYAVGGRWIPKSVKTLPAWKIDRRLEDALMAASLASGMVDRVRLFEIPNDDINAFSISLPDGTFAIFLSGGIAWKVPERERVAIIAHEIAHMQAGDTIIYTVMIRMAGRKSLKKMVGGLPGVGFSPLKGLNILFIAALFASIAMFVVFASVNASGPDFSSGTGFWLILAFLFVALLMSIPPLVNALLRLVLDRDREYHADMHAVYLTRDPAAVYEAVKLAAEDVRDVILLPACLDALLFCPVIDYSSYRPYRSQPTMLRRMTILRDAFPVLAV